MKKQTKFYDPTNNVRGNCMVTCYANALGLEPNDCPPFEQFFDVKYPDDFWQDVLHLWFNKLGYKLEKSMKDPLPQLNEHTFYFAVGPSERGIRHMVVWQNGKIYHDPHPSNSGLENVEYWEYLIPIQKDLKIQEGYTEIVKITEAAIESNPEKAIRYAKAYISKFPNGDFVKPFTALLIGDKNPDNLTNF